MDRNPRLLSLATAVPPFVLDQRDVAERARGLFAGRAGDIDRLMPVFANAGIVTRHSCVPLSWYLTASDWKRRNQIYVENAVRLLEEAACRSLDRAGLAPEAVDSIVTVSTTGIATPSLDALLMDRLPFRRDAQRLPVFGLGCAGGVLGLSRAATLARAQPGSTVLLLVVELCALTFRPEDRSKSNIIAAALFGDGAAAAVIGGSPLDGSDPATPRSAAPRFSAPRFSAPRFSAAGEHTWPDSLEVMGWRVENDGLGVLFSKDIPNIIRARYGDALDRFLDQAGLSRSDIDEFVCHPGGMKVVAAMEEVLELESGTLHDARDVLRRYGNMSAVTVLFVLEQALRRKAGRRLLLSALGPGFTVAFQLLDQIR